MTTMSRPDYSIRINSTKLTPQVVKGVKVPQIATKEERSVLKVRE